ncbi:MAG: type II toxin-antitoxin system RelE/ParE family toxin [Victivallaceae bacterium]|jgi:proteic killer suppression protein
MIHDFKCKLTKELWEHGKSRKFNPFARAAMRKLSMLNAAIDLNDLRIPPGNRLESLTGDRSGQHSIRINDQYRICFIWRDSGADAIEIVDYH